MADSESFTERFKSILSKNVISVGGRSVSVLAILILFIAGGASAALLNSFGVIQLTGEDIDVTQSVLVGGEALDSESPPETVFASNDLEAGEAKFGSVEVENQADAPAPISFTTTANGDYSADFQGANYMYSLVPVEASGTGTAEVTTVQSVSDTPDAGGMVTSSSMAVETNVEANFSVEPTSRLGNAAGMQFSVEPVSVAADQNGNLEASLTVDYLLGEDHTGVDRVGEVGSAHAPNTVEFQVEDTDYTVDQQTFEQVSLVYRGVETVSGNQVTLENPMVFDSEGNRLTESLSDVSSLGDDAQITEVSVRTESFSDTGETLNVVYDSVTFEGTDLIDSSTVTVDENIGSDTAHSETITLDPETRYRFGALMDTSVYLDPETSTFDLQTELNVPEAAAQ